MSKIKVTFHRTYEIEEKEVLQRLDEINGEVEHFDNDIKEQAELMAMNLMSEEMVYFEDNLNDFVSSTIEIIPNFK